MPHNISNHSNRAELAYTGKDPWHGLGTKVPGLMTTKEALTASGTDWQVEKVPVLSSYDMTVIPNHHTIIRKDTNYPLGIVGERYTPISNSEALSFFDDVLGEGAGAIEVCGALGNGEKIFALARFPEKFEVVSNDEVHTFMLVSTSHDGSSCVEILYTPVRVVCQNTLTTALKGKGNRYRVRHTASYKQNITQAKNILNDSKEYWEKLKEASIYMSKTSVRRKEV
jgi:phage/plasmid-like protein (TIGR03299 family)